MARRDRNQVEIEVRRIDRARGMIGDLIGRGDGYGNYRHVKVVLTTVFVKKFNCFGLSGRISPVVGRSGWWYQLYGDGLG
jgi:hypothetical protein